MKLKKAAGLLLFIKGTLLLTCSQSGITGHLVSERVDALSSIFSLIFIVGGLFLFIEYEEIEETLKEI